MNFLNKNLEIIDNENLDIKVKNAELSKIKVVFEKAKKRGKTVKVIKEGKEVYLSSRYDPISEAEKFYNTFGVLDEYEHILFIGVTSGYQIMKLLNENPFVKISIFEPNLLILKRFLEENNLSNYKSRIVEVFTETSDIKDKRYFLHCYINKTLEVIWPSYKIIYGEALKEFYKKIKEPLEFKKNDILANSLLQHRWTINPIMNFPILIDTPNLLIDFERGIFKNKPAVIVAAGPSLNEDLGYIKKVIEEKRAYVFAVGSAINALLAANIIPDAFVSVDPNYSNQMATERIKKYDKDIPFIFGSSIGFESLRGYKGTKISLILNQDKFSQFLLDFDRHLAIPDATTVTNMTMLALTELQMSPIIFAGQNMAFKDNHLYASGIDYESRPSTVEDSKKTITVEDVYGNLIYTDEQLNQMRTDMEYLIKQIQGINFINTTKGGARIEGAPFMEIEQVLKKHLKESNVVESNWYKQKVSYNKVQAIGNFSELSNSFKEFVKYLSACFNYVLKVKKMINNGKFNKIMLIFSGFDLLLDRLQDEIFFKVCIQPTTRVEHDRFIQESKKVAFEKNTRRKAKLFIEIYGGYLKIMYTIMEYLQPAFNEFINSELYLKYKRDLTKNE